MAKYVYPAIFTPEDDGGFSVRFPDVESCYTGSETLTGAMEMANDVLCMMLYEMEEHKREIPAPSSVPEIQKQAEDGEFVSLISCDTVEYRRFHDSKAVKKTLTIPSWLNEMAERAGVNFSYILQEALKQKLEIS